ncbi:MAG TPA: 8-amino-7-oxononanoate synthase [Gammaproteobacteria bacterium]|nr:8-amino-7-oxononanoate synthase [Gammaproteobacteria bacterium]
MMDELSAELERRRAAHLYRSRRVVEGPQGPEIDIDGRRYLSFCSNDYLGLANHPKVITALQSGAARYGAGSGAAHLVTGHSMPHHALEEELADFTGRPRALLFSTGYMANLGVVSALLGTGDAVFEDRLNHASLLDAGLLSRARLARYEHASPSALERRMGSSRARRRLVVTDGVFSMDGDLAPLPALAEVAARERGWLMVDDAHGLGVMGASGRGSLEHFGMALDAVPVLVGTLGKAFGTFGAFVAGEEALIETVIQSARSYVYTTALPPSVAEATRTSLRLVIDEPWRRDRLRTLIARLRAGLAALDLPRRGARLMDSPSPIQPLVVGSAERALAVSAALAARGVMVSAIRPPTVPEGTARLRITLSAAHDEAQVDRLLEALGESLAEAASDT